MNDLRDRIADAITRTMDSPPYTDRMVTDAVMPIVDEALAEAELAGRTQSADQIVEYQRRLREIDSDLLHAERENRRLTAELARAKGAS